MNDIDTIREALEHEKVITRLKPDYFRMLPDAQGEYVYFGHQQAALTSALAALERVSALQAEMEAALSFYMSICGNCGGSHISLETFQEMHHTAEKAFKSKESR